MSNKNITKYLIIYKNHKKIILYEKLKKKFFIKKNFSPKKKIMCS